MADISQTAASVVKTATSQMKIVIAGETLSAGMPVFKHTDEKYKKAKADTAANAAAEGITLNGAAVNQPVAITLDVGDVNVGATLVVGEVYCVSPANAGGIAPVADIVSTKYNTILGVATSTSNLKLGIMASGVVHG